MKIIPMLVCILISSTEIQATVANFALLDHQGRHHELYYYENDKDTRLIVLFVQGNSCPLVRKRIPELNALKEKYENKGVRFWMINANPQDEREDIAREAKEFNISWPILKDETQLVAQSLEIDRTAEALLIDTRTWEILYRGAIDDRLDYEAQKEKASRSYLREAIKAGLKGKRVAQFQTRSPGCAITFEFRLDDPDKISYPETIAPILLNRCVRCHQQGGIGPFSLSSYKKVRGWSGMIREVVMTRRMPPWQADSHFSPFSNDFSMTVEEKRQLVRWIDTGSPRGEGPDILAQHVPDVKEWPLGEPDLIVELGEQKIPAEGVVDYRYIIMDLSIKEDVWLRASHVNPGNTKVLHHVIATAISGGRWNRQSRGVGVGGYAPGSEPEPYPEGSGRLLPAGSKVRFQVHYTVTGKSETDLTRLGLYFHKTPPKKVFSGGAIMDFAFRIPPNAPEHPARGNYRVGRDIYLVSMFPHMHYRGKSMKYEAHYPDGKKEVLLSVPNYHFNWQRAYVLKEAKLLPAGTNIVVSGSWDNSALNRNNPDPSKTIYWGQQSWEEMFNAFFSFTYAE